METCLYFNKIKRKRSWRCKVGAMLSQQQLEVKHRHLPLYSLRERSHSISSSTAAATVNNSLHTWQLIYLLWKRLVTTTHTLRYTHTNARMHRKLLQKAIKWKVGVKKEVVKCFRSIQNKPNSTSYKRSIQSFPHRQFPDQMIKLANSPVCSQFRSAWRKRHIFI